VISKFFKFPHTPHLVWLGQRPPRSDKVLCPEDVTDFLSNSIVVEEKIDGSNIGFSLDANGWVRVQGRGEFLHQGAHRQFDPLWSWLEAHRNLLTKSLNSELILFGEWCFAVHAVHYNRLPDWFLGFDIFDRKSRRFWSTDRRNDWLQHLGMSAVPELVRGHFSLPSLMRLMGKSNFGDDPMEGIYVRCDDGPWLKSRAKIVRPTFLEQIDEHWSIRPLQKNALSQPMRITPPS